MIIWGSKVKQKELEEGSFFCPHCGKETCYKLKHLSKYFTLYSIPLFKTKDVGNFVECQLCRDVFNPQFLDPERQGLFKAAGATKDLLLQGNTPEEVKANYIAMGMKEEYADTVVAMAECYKLMAQDSSAAASVYAIAENFTPILRQ